jgi:excisionase family DNA binding protein
MATTRSKNASQQLSPVFETVDELAAELGLSRHSTYQHLRSGKIPSIRLGKRFIVPRAAIAEWLRTAGNLKLMA